jgi:transposase-like protein
MRLITHDPNFEKFKQWLLQHEKPSVPSAGEIAKEFGIHKSQAARWMRKAGYEYIGGRFVKVEK